VKDKALRDFSLWISGLAGGLSLVGCAVHWAKPFLFPSTIFVAGLASLLFLRILFSRYYRVGIDLANLRMQGNEPWPGKTRHLFDAEWGLFGQRVGPPPLLWIRAILFLGLFPAMLLQNWIGVQTLLLWFSATFVALEVSLMQVAIDAQMQNT
jgi:hypothetical protein